tara:strand:- start:100 stop:756 length:657 start_codon:yes stop_codon:yes gene_type:complete
MLSKENLSTWRKNKLNQCKEFPEHLFYMSKKKNFKSIIENGILPQNKANKIAYDSFADNEVQKLRSSISLHISGNQKCKLHDLVPLYFTALTPTLSRIREDQNNIFFCKISSIKLIADINKDFAFTDGNAASLDTIKYYSLNSLNKLNWKIINSDSWHDKPDGKRIRNSEFLIYPSIEIKYISEFVVNNNDLKNIFEIELNNKSIKIPVKVDKFCFFN